MIKKINYEDLKSFYVKKSSSPFIEYIGYYKNNILTGYIEYNLIYETIDIVNVFVLEPYRNLGIATELLKYLIENNKEKKNITLEVRVDNEYAIKLYTNLGFKKVAVRENYYKGKDGYLMELIL